MKKIVFATHNQGKLHEMRELLSDMDIAVVSAADAGFTSEVEEDQPDFAGNAAKKALAVSFATGEWSVADDSGLCIDVLDGAPGIFTARWADREKLVEHTLEKMKGQADRRAYLESAVALSSPAGEVRIFSGRVDGSIAEAPSGTALAGLPYDVIFIPDGHIQTFAQMSESEKNSMSHRGRAFLDLKEYITGLK